MYTGSCSRHPPRDRLEVLPVSCTLPEIEARNATRNVSSSSQPSRAVPLSSAFLGAIPPALRRDLWSAIAQPTLESPEEAARSADWIRPLEYSRFFRRRFRSSPGATKRFSPAHRFIATSSPLRCFFNGSVRPFLSDSNTHSFFISFFLEKSSCVYLPFFLVRPHPILRSLV